MRAAAVTLGLLAVVSVGCRNDRGRNAGESANEPGAKMPSAPEAPRAAEPPAIGGGPAGAIAKTSPIAAVARIAIARCDRELKCNNIGPKETYKTRGECITKMQSDKSEGINASACPGGINEANLNRCLQAIHDDACGNPIGTLGRLESCKTDGLCVK